MGFLEDKVNLADRVAIVLGGGGGLGRACALDLGRAGMRLVLADRNEEQLTATCAELREYGCTVFGQVLDVRDADAVTALFTTADERYGGRLDALLNVVGGTFEREFEQTNARGWQALVTANYTWLLHSTQLAIPRLRAAGGGSIVNFTSVEAHRAAPGFAVYAGLKAGVENFSRSLALELGRDRIRVNTLAADFTPTEGSMAITAHTQGPPDARLDALQDAIAIPLGRRGSYADIGSAALFLVSDLSTYVTGTCLHVDGGTWASAGWFRWPHEGWMNFPPPFAVRQIDADAGRTEPISSGR